MTGRFRSRKRVAIVGYGHSKVVRRSDEPLGVTTLRVAREAISDSGLEVKDIDGFVTASLFPTSGAHASQDGVSIVSANWLAEHLGADAEYAAGFQGIGQLTGSVSLAVNAVASGAADYVLVHRALYNPPGKYNDNPMKLASGSDQWGAPQGYFGSLPAIALAYNEYMQRYGATRESMAHVVSEGRKNGSRIPWSYWYEKPLSVDDYLAEPMVNEPMSRFDCDIPVHGVATFVITTADRAKDLPHKPVYVAGYASGYPREHRTPLHWTLDEMMDVGSGLANRLWRHSGISASEVDLPQVYDGFSPFVYLWLEVLGFCPVGEAHRFVLEGGIDSDIPGSIPVLSGGGAIGNGRMHGVPQMLECYLQLAGRAAERQRANVNVALACHSTPHYGGAVVYTNDATN